MTTDIITYNERAAIQDHQADAARFKTIGALFEKFSKCGKSVEKELVASVNLAREIGLELQGIAGAEQMQFGFYSERCAKLLPFGWDKVKQFISIARTLKDPVANGQGAVVVMEKVLMAQGTLALPEPRDMPQQSREVAPPTFVFTTFGTAWERIEHRLKDAAKWDADTRKSVRDEIERFERKAAEVKAKL